MYLSHARHKGGEEVEIYLKKRADIPLVGYCANDTENRFTAGIDNNSEEIKNANVTVKPELLVKKISQSKCISSHMWNMDSTKIGL